MKIYLGADHAGYKLKEEIKSWLDKKGIPYEDFGTYSTSSADYPDYADVVAKRVVKDKDSRGILICGTGTGMVIAANRVKGSRAVAAYDAYSAKMSRVDNDSNILALKGSKFVFKEIEKIMKIWLRTKFSNELRHRRRIRKLDK